jgi:hypothetical protein
MSMHEMGSKGKRGRELRVIMPKEDGDEVSDSEEQKDDNESEEDEGNFQSSTLGTSNGISNESSTRKVHTAISSFSESREQGFRFRKASNVNRNELYKTTHISSSFPDKADDRLLNSNARACIFNINTTFNVCPLEDLPQVDPMLLDTSCFFVSPNSEAMTLNSNHPQANPSIKMENRYFFFDIIRSSYTNSGLHFTVPTSR